MAYNSGNPNGQATAANSQPMVLASDQSAIPIKGNLGAYSTASWTYNSAVNTQLAMNVSVYNAVSVAWTTPSTVTGGAITFEVSPNSTTGSDGSWFPIAMARISTYNSESTLTVAASQTYAWTTSVDGFTYFRVRVSTVLAGTAGTAAVFITPQTFAIEPLVTVGQATAGNLQATVTGNVNATLVAGTNQAGQVGLTPTTSTVGLSIYSNQALSSTAVSVKAGVTRMHEYDFYNPNSTGVWVQFFNVLVASVTVGTTSPTRTMYIPPTSGRDWASPYSSAWTTALVIACTTTNTGSTAPSLPIQVYMGYI